MSSLQPLEPTERFFRPENVENIRRNYRGIQLRSLLRVALNGAVAAAVIAAAVIAWRHTQSDARFAVRQVQVTGTVHTSRAAIDSLAHSYVGLNLFRLDIDRVRRDLTSLDWVSRIEIEKALPDTLRIRIVERTPLALQVVGGALRYVDENGVAFAELSPAAGDSDLPIIIAGNPGDSARAVQLIRRLRTEDAAVFARISEVRPLLPHGFALFDRELNATVFAEEDDVSSKWREWWAIAAAEKYRPGDVAYADLRFNGRIVVKPVRPAVAPVTPAPQNVPLPITN